MTGGRYAVWGQAFVLALGMACCSPGAGDVGTTPESKVGLVQTPGGEALPVATALFTRTPLPPPALPTQTPRATVSQTSTATPNPTFVPTATAVPSHTPTVPVCEERVGRVLMATFPSPTQGRDANGNSAQVPYRIYLPPCYGQDGRLYPALYLFHGNIYNESQWDDLGIDEAADAAITGGEIPPFLIVMPFGGEIANSTSGGDWSFERVVLDELIPHVESQHCAWPQAAGRAIGGLSRGGYWSLEIGFRHPELFAAVGGHSPALFPDNAGPAYNPLTTGTSTHLTGLAIYLDVGDQDWLRQGVLDLHAVMTGAGIAHQWHLNPGSHGDPYWREHTAAYLAWYASHWPEDVAGYPAVDGRSCSP